MPKNEPNHQMQSLWSTLHVQRRKIAISYRQRVQREQLGLIAAAISFYITLAIVPGLLALWSLIGIYVEPEAIEKLLPTLLPELPVRSYSMFMRQLRAISAHPPGSLTLGFWFSLLGMLWATSSGMEGLLCGLQRAVGLRPAAFVRQRALALGLTVFVIVFVMFLIFLNSAMPALLRAFELHTWSAAYLRFGRWPTLVLLWLAGIETLFRVVFRGSKRPSMLWRRTPTPGAVLAVIAALTGTYAFTYYADRWGRWEATYGTLAGVAILLLWLYALAFALLLGATLNAELTSSVEGRPLHHG